SVKIEKAVPERLVTNPTVLGKLRESWKIPDQKKEKVGKLWNIRFIQYVEEGNVEAAKEGLLEELKKMGLSEGNDFHMRFASAQGDLATLNSLFDSLDEQCDLIVALSTPTLQCALKKARGIPVIFTNVADAVRAGAGKSNKEHLPNVTGVLTMSDFDGMVEAVKECLPDAKRIGTLFVPAEINSVIYRDALAASAEKAGLTLESVGISSSSEIADGALSLGAKNLDAICQISDNTNNVGFAGIVQAARKEKIPLFAFVGKQVKSEGAVAGVTRDYEQAGRDAAQMVGRVMRGESPANIPFELVSKTVTLVNLKNAALFGLNIPASFLKKAKRVD
ncbi:MAG TPA: hypothetical protein DD435_04285, partial [Cyanobacteria bacterium UBA8530]|nr:hypothetical protein [Cyanobacteria bacterium UBA8530]